MSWPGRLNSAARRRSAIAMPTALPRPWPSGPVVASTPGVRPYSGWPGRDRAPLAERLEVVEAHLVAGEVEQRVQQHRRVPGREHEPVAVGPVRVRRRVAEVARPQRVRHRRGAHRRARVPGVGLLDAVDREGPDGVDREPIERSVARVIALSGGADVSDRAPTGQRRRARRGGSCRDRSSYRNAAHPGGILRGHARHPVSRRDATRIRTRRGATAGGRRGRRHRRRRDAGARARRSSSGRTSRAGCIARAGGSAATAARWLGRLGRASTLVCAIGRDAAGRALVAAATADGVTVGRCAWRARGPDGSACSWSATASVRSSRTGAPRSCSAPRTSRPDWFAGADAVHLPAYSLLDEPLGRAGMAAIGSPATPARS